MQDRNLRVQPIITDSEPLEIECRRVRYEHLHSNANVILMLVILPSFREAEPAGLPIGYLHKQLQRPLKGSGDLRCQGYQPQHCYSLPTQKTTGHGYVASVAPPIQP